MRYRIRLRRVQVTERTVSARDERSAIEQVLSQLHQGSIYGPWTSGDVEAEVLAVENRVGGLDVPVPEGPMLYSIKQAAEQLGLSRATVYELINRGEVEHMRVGRRVLIPQDALRSFIDANRTS